MYKFMKRGEAKNCFRVVVRLVYPMVLLVSSSSSRNVRHSLLPRDMIPIFVNKKKMSRTYMYTLPVNWHSHTLAHACTLPPCTC